MAPHDEKSRDVPFSLRSHASVPRYCRFIMQVGSFLACKKTYESMVSQLRPAAINSITRCLIGEGFVAGFSGSWARVAPPPAMTVSPATRAIPTQRNVIAVPRREVDAPSVRVHFRSEEQ